MTDAASTANAELPELKTRRPREFYETLDPYLGERQRWSSVSVVSDGKNDILAVWAWADLLLAEIERLRSLVGAQSTSHSSDSLSEYLADYDFRFDGGACYTPTEAEKAMLEDAILGYLAALSQNAEPANHGTDESRLTLYGADPATVGDDRESMGSGPVKGIVTGGSDPTPSLPSTDRSTPESSR